MERYQYFIENLEKSKQSDLLYTWGENKLFAGFDQGFSVYSEGG